MQCPSTRTINSPMASARAAFNPAAWIRPGLSRTLTNRWDAAISRVWSPDPPSATKISMMAGYDWDSIALRQACRWSSSLSAGTITETVGSAPNRREVRAAPHEMALMRRAPRLDASSSAQGEDGHDRPGQDDQIEAERLVLDVVEVVAELHTGVVDAAPVAGVDLSPSG